MLEHFLIMTGIYILYFSCVKNNYWLFIKRDSNFFSNTCYYSLTQQLLTALGRARTSLLAGPALQFGGAPRLVAHVESYRGVASVI